MKALEETKKVMNFNYENEHILVKAKWEKFLRRINNIDGVEAKGIYDFCENDKEIEVNINDKTIHIEGGEIEWTEEEFEEYREDIIIIMKKENLIVLMGFKKKTKKD